jgi:hypothetical protein
MKQLLLLTFISFLAIDMTAQTCVPDELYRDSVAGVYPRPYHPDTNPEGGIPESACINAPYEFVLTFVIPETVTISTLELFLDSIVIAEEGAVGGLPVGFNYSCNPGNCVFTPGDTIACLVIYGTATDANTPGVYPLTITTNIYTNLIDQEVTFPSPLIPGADGEYNLTLEEEGASTCFVGTNDYLTKNIRISNNPNPFGSSTNFELNSKVDETLQFRVFDMLGNLVHFREVEIFQGFNNFEFDGTALSNGIYTYTLSNKTAVISKKMVISR